MGDVWRSVSEAAAQRRPLRVRSRDGESGRWAEGAGDEQPSGEDEDRGDNDVADGGAAKQHDNLLTDGLLGSKVQSVAGPVKPAKLGVTGAGGPAASAAPQEGASEPSARASAAPSSRSASLTLTSPRSKAEQA